MCLIAFIRHVQVLYMCYISFNVDQLEAQYSHYIVSVYSVSWTYSDEPIYLYVQQVSWTLYIE